VRNQPRNCTVPACCSELQEAGFSATAPMASLAGWNAYGCSNSIGGIFKSTDGGVTWNRVRRTPDGVSSGKTLFA
jgi:photosystem II stability/assembly factor-like uncharacterized protein